ncbi:MAG TPA: hypothetical protein VFR33_00710 [Candidatus Dormibacteraeota bacterium]|nr:hypothetical protein [Candidatus Dormibacteraeota bacterium]
MTGNSKLLGQLWDPQEQAPPQAHPPPLLDSLEKSESDDVSPPLENAKLETMTRVFVDSHAGHIWAVSRSAKPVRTSNVSAQLSHRYS